MKKIILFLIIFALIYPMQSKAQSIQFYEAEFIDNVWITKVTPDRVTKYYQTARFFRRKDTNEPAYCIEPFNMFNENSQYQSVINPEKLTKEQIDRIKQLAYLGYNYNSRTSNEWYGITQFLIWQTVETSGEYYFTEGLTGPRTDKFQNLIDELNKEVENYNNNPEIKKEHKIVAGEKIEINLPNIENYNYTVNNKYAKITDNKLEINNLPEGNHEIILTKEVKEKKQPIIFYQSSNSQSLMTIGTIEPQNIKININVYETEIHITKIDSDTNSTQSSGEAELNNTEYKLYDKNMNEINTLIINEKKVTSIKNIQFGTYFIKESIPGKGYELDPKTYKIELNEKSPKIKLTLKNNVIKGTIIINKKYVDEHKELPEENITFNIYDKNKKLYKTIKTNQDGTTSTTLPYGNYTIKQINTTEGYDYIEPFIISIKDTSTQTYNLKNNKIKGTIIINKKYIDEDKELPEENITFNIYDENNELYKSIKTNKDGYASIKLPYGNYTIKQINTTEGYDYIEPFTISIKNSSTQTYNLKNNKIKGTIIINKKYIDEDKELPEENITFNIYDENNELYKSIKTNKDGFASTTLPYGNYTIKQLDTTEGYDYIEPFTISIKNTAPLTYNLKNYKIKIPNTYITENNNKIIKIIISIIKFILYAY